MSVSDSCLNNTSPGLLAEVSEQERTRKNKSEQERTRANKKEQERTRKNKKEQERIRVSNST
jgi:hypothetical protein